MGEAKWFLGLRILRDRYFFHFLESIFSHQVGFLSLLLWLSHLERTDQKRPPFPCNL